MSTHPAKYIKVKRCNVRLFVLHPVCPVLLTQEPKFFDDNGYPRRFGNGEQGCPRSSELCHYIHPNEPEWITTAPSRPPPHHLVEQQYSQARRDSSSSSTYRLRSPNDARYSPSRRDSMDYTSPPRYRDDMDYQSPPRYRDDMGRGGPRSPAASTSSGHRGDTDSRRFHSEDTRWTKRASQDRRRDSTSRHRKDENGSTYPLHPLLRSSHPTEALSSLSNRRPSGELHSVPPPPPPSIPAPLQPPPPLPKEPAFLSSHSPLQIKKEPTFDERCAAWDQRIK